MTARAFEPLLRDQRIKNGFILTTIEYDKLNAQMRELRMMSADLIKAIDAEMEGR